MFTKSFVFSLFVLAACATARADVTVLNTKDATLSTPGGGQFLHSGFSMGTMIAESFVTGGSLLTLSNVVFPQISQTGTGPTAVNSDGYSATETFTLYTDSTLTGTSRPGLPRFTFTLQNDPNADPFANADTFGETTATVPAAVAALGLSTLSANTRYWLVLSNVTNVSWNYLAPGTGFSTAQGYTLPATGTVITDDPTGTPIESITDLSDGPQQFVLNVVPEPSTYCLLAVAGLALVVSRKRAHKVA